MQFLTSIYVNLFLFNYLNRIVRKGYKNDLTANDLWNLKKTERTPYVGHIFLKAWKKALGDKKSIDSNVFSE